MRLQTATWPEVETYLDNSKGIIVPIGSTEQHGPNGMLGTDAICPETIAFGVAESIDVLIAPTISIGQGPPSSGLPGNHCIASQHPARGDRRCRTLTLSSGLSPHLFSQWPWR